MSIGACIVIIGVELYLLIYSYKVIKTIKCFYNALGHCKGQVVEEFEIKEYKDKECTIKTSYPIYSFVLNGKDIRFKGTVRYRDLKLGESVDISYDEDKEMYWCEKDIPILKKGLLVRISTMQILLIAMIIIENVFG